MDGKGKTCKVQLNGNGSDHKNEEVEFIMLKKIGKYE
jgi:hypothetical protein